MVEIALKLLSRKKDKRAITRSLTGDKLVRQGGVRASDLAVDAQDVQGLAFRGYGALPECHYAMLQFSDAAQARGWLAQLLPGIARGIPAAGAQALHVAFTHEGLAALGVSAAVREQFSRQFIEGMVAPHRSRFLGDELESAPDGWLWGGPNTPAVHAALIVLAKDKPALAAQRQQLEAAWTAAGVTEVYGLESATLSPTEHFGFADGISQPVIEGYHPTPPSDLHRVKAGEFLLGYENEYDLYTERPLLSQSLDMRGVLPLDVEGSPRRDLGRNGTYLVFRQLRQHVPAFRGAIDGLTRRPDGTPDPAAAQRLAAQMVGRWPSGASLIEAPDSDDVSKATRNEFRYHDADPEGIKCPMGSHVRRANPRDALDPQPGSERSLSINRRHRIIRRGRSYGEPLAPGATDDADRGLMFIGVGANISRQFEFIQHSWIADPRFHGFFNEADPIVGARADNDFVAPGDPVRRRYSGLPRFVTVAGGAYFFMPGLAALRFLVESTP